MVNSSEKMKDNRTMDSTESLSSFYLSSRDPVFIIDKKGEFIGVNNAFCQKFGLTKEEILRVNIWEASFLTNKAREKALFRNVSRLIGKETRVYTLDVVDKSGDVFSLEIDTKPYIKDKIVAGEIGIVKNEKKIIHKTENTKVLSESEKIPEKSDGVKRLQSTPEERSMDRGLLKHEIRRITRKWRSNQSELVEKNYEIRWLKNELEKTQQTLKIQKIEFEELKGELRNYKSTLEEKNFNVERIQDELEKTQSDLKEKDKEIKQLKKELEDKFNEKLKTGDEGGEKQFVELSDEELKHHEEQITKLKTELEQKQQEIENKNQEIQTKEEGTQKIQQKLEDKNTNNTTTNRTTTKKQPNNNTKRETRH